MPAKAPPFAAQGDFYFRGAADYEPHAYQYASSSHTGMQPAVIFYAKDENGIIEAVKYAAANKLAMAIRTGGHQYSGASSTFGNNIQIDVTGMPDVWDWDPVTGLLRVSVNYALMDFNARLGQTPAGSGFLFIPHGQCSHVHLGGHAQTGGYGQLGRSFGLFGDHIESFEIITADARKQIIRRNSTDPGDQELFYAVLGGSPGNYGVLTHLTLRPHKDIDHPNSHGLKAAYLYDRDTLKKLFDVMAAMSDDANYPGDFDYCVTVLSAAEIVFEGFCPNMDETMAAQYKAQ